MGFLKKIFKKKKGGTKLGNFLRGAAKKLTGGKAGNGKNKIVDSNNPDKDSNLVKFGSVVGQYANDVLTPVISEALTGNKESNSTNAVSAITDPFVDSAMGSLWDSLKKRWYLIALPFGLIIFIVWYVSTRNKTKKRFYR